KMLSHHAGFTSTLLTVAMTALERAADQVVKRDRAAAVDEEVERRDRPHERVFEPELIPEIFSDPPALEVGHHEEDHDRHGGRPREQPECQQWSADKLRERDGRGPEFSRPIAVAVELCGELS